MPTAEASVCMRRPGCRSGLCARRWQPRAAPCPVAHACEVVGLKWCEAQADCSYASAVPPGGDVRRVGVYVHRRIPCGATR